MTFCIQLNPLCNRDFRHVADDLVYRNEEGESASLVSPTSEAARACSSAFFEIGLNRLVGDRHLVISVTADITAQLGMLDLPADQIIIRPIAYPSRSPSAASDLNALRNLGYRVMLSPVQAGQLPLQPGDFLELSLTRAQNAKIDIQTQAPGCHLLVTDIQSYQDCQAALALGGEWLQGPFFADAVPIATPLRQRKGNLAAQLSLLQELYKPEPAVDRLETLLAQDPHLVMLVLRQANNRVLGRRIEIASIRQASMLLGLDHLQGMVTQLLLANNDPLCTYKLKRMMMRAAMCSRVAQRLNLGDSSEAFALGLFSLMDSYQGITMDELVSLVPFTPRTREALVQRTGDLGQLLKLVESFESAQTRQTQGPVVAMLNTEYLESLVWLEQVFVGDLPVQ